MIYHTSVYHTHALVHRECNLLSLFVYVIIWLPFFYVMGIYRHMHMWRIVKVCVNVGTYLWKKSMCRYVHRCRYTVHLCVDACVYILVCVCMFICTRRTGRVCVCVYVLVHVMIRLYICMRAIVWYHLRCCNVMCFWACRHEGVDVWICEVRVYACKHMCKKHLHTSFIYIHIYIYRFMCASMWE